MTLSEGAVILFGLFAGYWVVSKLFFRPPQPKAAPKPEGTASAGTAAGGAEPAAGTGPAAGPGPAWHEILGVPADATADQIREAYQHLISNYHPDKVDDAYREAMRSRGVDP